MKRLGVLVAGACLATSVIAAVVAPNASSAASCAVPETGKPYVKDAADATVDGSPVPVKLAGKKGKWDIDLSDVPEGGLFFLQSYEAYDESDTAGHHCRLDTTVLLERKYPAAGWAGFLGLNSFLLNQTAYAQAIDPGYSPATNVDENTPIVLKLSLPADGTYKASNYYGTDSYGYLDTASTSNQPITVNPDEQSITVHAKPAYTVFDTEVWPKNLPADYEPDSATVIAYGKGSEASAAQNYLKNVGGLDLSNGDTSGMPQRLSCTKQDTKNHPGTRLGGADAHKFEAGLHYRVVINFSDVRTGTDKNSVVHEWQRGSWNEMVNSGCSSLQYYTDSASGSRGLVLNANNYHQFLDTTPVEGSLRVMYPDAWTSQAFSVTGDSAPEELENAIAVTRQEKTEGTTAVVVTATPVAGVGVIVDAGKFGFSKPKYRVFRKQLAATRTSPSTARIYVNIGQKALKKCKYTKATTTYSCTVSLTFANDLDSYKFRGRTKYRNRTARFVVTFLRGAKNPVEHGFQMIDVGATEFKRTTSLRALDATKYTVAIGNLKIGTVTVQAPIPT